jgi:hypothetical protein
MSYSTVVWPLSTFPVSPSIPPYNFYNLNEGLATYLNRNPQYKQFFVNNNDYFPFLFTSSVISEWVATGSTSLLISNYKMENVPLQPYITNMSDYQSRKYREQFDIFLKVYTYNSNAYVNFRNNNMTTNPIYYRFTSYNEYMNYKAGVSLVNKAYPFDRMANGKNEVGSTLNWIVPFPL